jgi:hypothetical protein
MTMACRALRVLQFVLRTLVNGLMPAYPFQMGIVSLLRGPYDFQIPPTSSVAFAQGLQAHVRCS